jgi:hypothetical protein
VYYLELFREQHYETILFVLQEKIILQFTKMVHLTNLKFSPQYLLKHIIKKQNLFKYSTILIKNILVCVLQSMFDIDSTMTEFLMLLCVITSGAPRIFFFFFWVGGVKVKI